MTSARALRPVVDRMAALTGVLRARERAMCRGLTLLTYHRVLPDHFRRGSLFPSLVTPLSLFREEVKHLASACRVVPVGQGIAALAERGMHRPPLVGLTFDDGYADGFACAAPVLEEHGVRGTFFVTTGPVGTGAPLWFDAAASAWAGLDWRDVHAAVARCTNAAAVPAAASSSPAGGVGFLKTLTADQRRQLLAELGGAPERVSVPFDRAMTPREIADLARRGHEIGSHSVTHPLLPCATEAEVAEELSASRRHLAGWIGAPPEGFCYPNGDHDERIIAATRRAGYAYACTTLPGRNLASQDPFRLLRIDMNPRRVTRGDGFDRLAMRAEISLLHEALR